MARFNIWKEKSLKSFQVLITIQDTITNEAVSAFINIADLEDFETKVNSLTPTQIKSALTSEYKTLIRTFN